MTTSAAYRAALAVVLGIAPASCAREISSLPEIAARFGSDEAFQAWALDAWMERLTRNAEGIEAAVLDAQVRPASNESLKGTSASAPFRIGRMAPNPRACSSKSRHVVLSS